MWSEPRNLVGSPRNRVTTASAIGSVLPEGSNFEFSVPLDGLSGRGLSAGIALKGWIEELSRVEPARAVEDRYRAVLKENRARDAAAGRTLDGAHLTDLAVTYNINGAVAGSSTTASRVPYQGFNTITYQDSMGNSEYDAMQLRVERRFMNGFSLLSRTPGVSPSIWAAVRWLRT